jgi:CheY-like chemotaxis protein
VKGRHILVVEDDEDIRETLAGALRDEAYEVTTARDGRDALEALERTAVLPNAIVLDLMMPVMSGWEFRARQRTDPRAGRVPVVILTGDPRAREIGSELAAAAWLRKPVSLNGLLEAVQRVMASG